VAAIGTGSGFNQGRDFAAWLGLVPKQESTGDRTKLGRISKRGNKYLRTLFVQAAHVVLERRPAAARRALWPWIHQASRRLAHRNAQWEMIGPIPGTVIKRWQAASFAERLSISADGASRRSSRRRQSPSSSPMRRSMRGEMASGGELKTSGSTLRKGTGPWRTVMPRSMRKPRI
jgi:hypothetical protein